MKSLCLFILALYVTSELIHMIWSILTRLNAVFKQDSINGLRLFHEFKHNQGQNHSNFTNSTSKNRSEL